MRTRTRNAVALLIAAAALCAALVLAARATPSRPQVSSPLQAVPERASLVAWAHLQRLRASPLSRLVTEASASQTRGAPDCSLQMFERVRQASLWVAEGSQDFGLAALGDFQRDEFLRCASEAIGARGGTATTHVSEGYTVVRDPALGEGAALLALRDRGPVLLGRTRELSRMMAAMDGRATSAMHDGEHARMREALKMEGDVGVTAVATDAFRAQLRAMAEQGGLELGAIRAVAAAVEAGSTAHVRVLVWCDAAGACEALARSIEALLSELRGSAPMRLAGVAGLLRDAVVGAREGQLVLDARAPAEEVVSVLQRVWRWDEALGSPTLPQAPTLSLPEEVLRAPGLPRRDGGR